MQESGNLQLSSGKWQEGGVLISCCPTCKPMMLTPAASALSHRSPPPALISPLLPFAYSQDSTVPPQKRGDPSPAADDLLGDADPPGGNRTLMSVPGVTIFSSFFTRVGLLGHHRRGVTSGRELRTDTQTKPPLLHYPLLRWHCRGPCEPSLALLTGKPVV